MARRSRVEPCLQRLVQRVDPRRAAIHRREHLNVAQRIEAIARGQPPGDEIHDQPLRGDRVLLAQEEEVAGWVAIERGHLADVDAVRRDDDGALARLAK